MKRLLLTLLTVTALLTACGAEYPNEQDIAAAWQSYQPKLATLYAPESMSELKCTKAGNQAVYCAYKMGGIVHSDVLKKTSNGHWQILMLSKKDEPDDSLE